MSFGSQEWVAMGHQHVGSAHAEDHPGPARTAGSTTTRTVDICLDHHPGQVMALQRHTGNAAVAGLLRHGADGVRPLTVQPRGRRRGGNKGTQTPKTQQVRVPITETTVKKTPEVSTTTAPDESTGEFIGGVSGGLLDIWEGLETVTDSNKNVETRVGGGSKVVGGTSAVLTNVGTSTKMISEATTNGGALVGEVCGFISTAAECITAVREAYSKDNWERLLEFGKNIGPLVNGAIKTMEAYTKAVANTEYFSKWISQGLAPALGMMSSAVKALTKFRDLYNLSEQRRQLAGSLSGMTQGLKTRGQTLVDIIDSKWYRGAVELLSTMAEFSGEAIKWAGWGVGWLTGSLVSSGSKLLPLGVKTFNWLWQTANDWGGTLIWGGKTTAQLTSDMDSLVSAIVSERRRPFGKLMCQAIGLPLSEAGNKVRVREALLAYSA